MKPLSGRLRLGSKSVCKLCAIPGSKVIVFARSAIFTPKIVESDSQAIVG